MSEIKGGSVPKEYIPGVQKGIASVLGAGVIAGFPVRSFAYAYVDLVSYVMAISLCHGFHIEGSYRVVH